MYRFSFKQPLVLLLCLMIMLGMMPITTSASGDMEHSSEIIALREENIKHFDMGDGTYRAVVYGHPVHVQDDNGNWQNIDFGLSSSRTRGTKIYTNKSSGSTFAANYTPNQLSLMSLADGDTAISMTLLVPQTGLNTWTKQTSVAAKVSETEYSYDTFE